MEVYSEVENDASNTYLDDTIAGITREKYEGLYHNMQMVYYIEEEKDVDRSDLISKGIFKPTSGNAIKRLRVCQETHTTTNVFQNAVVTLK